MTEDIKLFQAKLNDAIKQLSFDEHPKELYDPIRYTLELGGKRMRPILAIMSYLTIKKDWESVVNPALAIELFHNFTLLHDDIMDEAPLRRGKPTVYKKWNKNIAILSGDALMILAYELILEADYKDLKHLIKLFNRCALDVCEGQQFDMNFESLDVVTEEEYINMIRLKTAVLLGFSLEFGALLGGLTKDQAIKFREFGIHIGIGFQLKDDMLDVYGDAEKFGKQVGGDIISNKKTYLLIKAQELAEGRQKDALEYWLQVTDFDAEEKVKSIVDIYDHCGIHELAEAKMNEYFAKGFEQLSGLDIPDENLKSLKYFTQFLINRDH